MYLRLNDSQILECVAINVTLVYALLAYANIKQKDLGNILVCIIENNCCIDPVIFDVQLIYPMQETLGGRNTPVWSRSKTFVVYCIAW